MEAIENAEARRAYKNLKAAEYRARHRDKINEKQRADRLVRRDHHNQLAKSWREKNPDKVRAAAMRWRKKYPERYKSMLEEWRKQNPDRTRLHAHNHYYNNHDKCLERQRKYQTLKRYGLTQDDWISLFVAQQYSCAVCKTEHPGCKQGWHTDHCHTSGKVRGILCQHCNTTLGHSKESTERLSALIEYINKHHAEN